MPQVPLAEHHNMCLDHLSWQTPHHRAPFFFQRLDIIPMETTKLKRPIISYLKENVHHTFSGMHFPPTFLDLLLELGGIDRVMFSADYPYQSMSQARFWSKFPSAPLTKSE